ncbi:MAG: hypothetical protein JOZ77_06455 [Candidatus Eremiobacteraeota bacterium]|nr:hypothetical protein [Candidatus Eremiobacteraeota bacterium]
MPATQDASNAQPLNSPYKQIYRFPGTPGGSGPTGILYDHGVFYGTTTGGGAKTLGTVFARGVNGVVRVLYSFQGGLDGAEPDGTLLAIDDTLYGTTQRGGAHGDGTVFAVTKAGAERVIYSFKGGSDGATPILVGLLSVNGELYGATNAGGSSSCHYKDIVGCGTIFKVSTSGAESVVYRFKGKPDGACPSGSLIESNGELYGTTNFGGKYDDGSVFKITLSGDETTIYSFKGYPDGVTPFAGLTPLNGNFYGTTALGGALEGAGTVFEITPTGTERVLHSFAGAPDGALPYAPLLALGGKLYGTTEDGGSSDQPCIGHGIVGCGVVFSITTSGQSSVLYRFKGHLDGGSPWSSVISAEDGLYGTTLSGGNHDNGTLFEIAR